MHKDHIALRLGELQKHTLFFPQLALGVAKHIKQLVYRAPEIRQRVVFAGDNVLGLGTTVVPPPPHGDMAQYIDSLGKMQALDAELMCCGHGPVVREPNRKLQELIDHRHEREEQIVSLVRDGRDTVKRIVRAVYPELDKRLLSIAEIAAVQLRTDLLANLVREPALATVRATLEQDLSAFRVEGLEGLAVYTSGGVELARSRVTQSDYPDVTVLLQSLLNLQHPVDRAVSELYRLSAGEYFKAAAISIEVGATEPLILVVWGGADFMAVIDKIVGSLFWIVLVSIVVAVSLAAVFS
ncbi:MAG: hypothetical protein IIA98_02265, partial [Proteobacteria bacterium]|nr:hypothetical protein [Pseudomonadota bacterium]